jgi:hypothetical protein
VVAQDVKEGMDNNQFDRYALTLSFFILGVLFLLLYAPIVLTLFDYFGGVFF